MNNPDIISVNHENNTVRMYHPPKVKPVINFWRYGDPCFKLDLLDSKIVKDPPGFNVVRCKTFTPDFLNFCLRNKDVLFLHIYISGLNSSIFEPNIPPVESIFKSIKYLIDNGFRQEQLLIIVSPIIPNDNGIKILELILRVFTEFKELRLRFIKFELLQYTQNNNGKYYPKNKSITNRQGIDKIIPFIQYFPNFNQSYQRLLHKYSTIISIDRGEEALIGIRELRAFGLRNEWQDENGQLHKIIEYEDNNKYKPIVNNISGRMTRCRNRCMLCQNYG